MSNLYKIGDVSKLCNISIKTLRYYEEMKLIKPVEVDKYTGYRYYDEDNIQTIYKIQFLKNLGLPLKDIKNFDGNSFEQELQHMRVRIISKMALRHNAPIKLLHLHELIWD